MILNLIDFSYKIIPLQCLVRKVPFWEIVELGIKLHTNERRDLAAWKIGGKERQIKARSAVKAAMKKQNLGYLNKHRTQQYLMRCVKIDKDAYFRNQIIWIFREIWMKLTLTYYKKRNKTKSTEFAIFMCVKHLRALMPLQRRWHF